VRTLLAGAGIVDAVIEAEAGCQTLLTPEDWWTVVLGSGFRWTVDQMGPEIAGQARAQNIRKMGESGATEIETNVIYALARKPK
jgi:hypothetical protein